MNQIETWQQGRFIDKPQYNKAGDLWKDEKRREEKHLVRPAPEENAICWCPNPDHAEWIAQRLNLASKLEQMTYDYATGKTDATEIISFVRSAANDTTE